ncbi:hypothetical protein ACFL4R_01170 [Nitrospirota bacterium]
MKIILSFILVLCLFNIALAANEANMLSIEGLEYTPNIMDNKQEAKELLKLRLLDQYHNAPNDVEVTDKYLRLFKSGTKRSALVGGVASVSVTEFIAFDNIGSIKIEERRDGRFQIEIKDRGNVLKAMFYYSIREHALEFFDALFTLINDTSSQEVQAP